MHHVTMGWDTPEQKAWVVIFWCIFWLFVFGLPCVLALYAKPWFPEENPDPDAAHGPPDTVHSH